MGAPPDTSTVASPKLQPEDRLRGAVSRYDVLVIGTGAAASTVARKCAKAGKKVAIVDSRPYGGTCALRGCDPKKVLVGATTLLETVRRMSKAGVRAPDATIAWQDLMAFKRTFTEPVPESVERSFDSAGIDTLHGRARFTGKDKVVVADQEVQAERIVIATGAKPRPLDMPGADKIIDSTRFLDLESLPNRIAFIGGGYISFEFAHLACIAGAKTTILHNMARPLGKFDPDLVDRLVEASRALGVEIRLDAPVTAVEGEGPYEVQTKDGGTVTADLVVHGAGRVPEIDDLDLETGGVERDKKGVVVDEHLRSVSNPHVYAAGDAAASPGLPLTPVATAEGHTVAANIIKENARTVDYTGTASVVFTSPPLAGVGLTEQEAADQGLDVKVEQGDMTDWFSYRRLNDRVAGYKVLVDRSTGRIVGAHILGAHAGETICLFALAIREKIPASHLKKVPWAYPSHVSDLPYMV